MLNQHRTIRHVLLAHLTVVLLWSVGCLDPLSWLYFRGPSGDYSKTRNIKLENGETIELKSFGYFSSQYEWSPDLVYHVFLVAEVKSSESSEGFLLSTDSITCTIEGIALENLNTENAGHSKTENHRAVAEFRGNLDRKLENIITGRMSKDAIVTFDLKHLVTINGNQVPLDTVQLIDRKTAHFR